MKRRSPLDLTEGQPWKQILRFMMPMLLGNIAQQFYNTADSIIVGRYSYWLYRRMKLRNESLSKERILWREVS